MVVKDGRILESGNHESLLNMKGYYHRVFYHQYGDFDQYKILKKEMGIDLAEINTTSMRHYRQSLVSPI